MTPIRDLSRHGFRVEFQKSEILHLGLAELFVVVLGTIAHLDNFQSDQMLGSGRNETNGSLLGIPRLGTHGIEERRQRILLDSSLGFRLGSDFGTEYEDCNRWF